MRLPFGSEPWCQRLKAAFEEAAAQRTDEERAICYTLCEVYLEPPDSLHPVDGKVAWHVDFSPSGAHWAMGEVESADILIRGRYLEMAELCRIIVDGEASKREEMDRLIRAARRGGFLTYSNKLGFQPTFTAGVHDVMARVTE